MPASEQTWREQKLLHKVFAVCCVILLGATMWMFAADHNREWKPIQTKANDIELQMTDWRKVQFDTAQAEDRQNELQAALLAIRGQAFDRGLIDQFKQEVREDAERRGVASGRIERQVERIESNYAELEKLGAAAEAIAAEVRSKETTAAGLQEAATAAAARAAAEQKRLAAGAEPKAGETPATEASVQQLQTQANKLADDAELARSEANAARLRLEEAYQDAGRARARMQDWVLAPIIRSARFREDDALGIRKFKSAELDAAKGKLGLAVSAGRSDQELEEIQLEVTALKQELERLTLIYQAAAQHRAQLQQLLGEMTEAEREIEKEQQDSLADLRRLDTTTLERRSRYFEIAWGVVPVPGKKWLEMPILDAFNSPRKIENLWSDGLTQDINFGKVRRFDRCTTCHQAIDATLPGSAVDGAYQSERLVEVAILVPSAEELAEAGIDDVTIDSSGDERQLDRRLEAVLGLRLAGEGLLDRNDVTVKYVRTDSPAARAAPLRHHGAEMTGEELRKQLLTHDNPALDRDLNRRGFFVGDVIAAIEGDPMDDKRRATYRLLDAAAERSAAEDGSRSVVVTIRRGLPNPYASHPRLDLFVGSLSPHSKAVFACTVCHEGQGSATSFKWASHVPDSKEQRARWKAEYGWFDNHHWIYPMYPKRFAESSCLKCHHEVIELQPSEKYPEPPAPKLTQGHRLLKKYGCYGCHEINGYDGPDKRVGPDLRLEPNVFAVAQQIKGVKESGFEKLTEDEQQWVNRLVTHPEDDVTRRRLLELILADAAQPNVDQRLSTAVHNQLGPLLKDNETPGSLRKAGPSLRFVNNKLDSAFLFDWLNDPQHFRPSTRMPRFFNLFDHLDAKGKAVAQRYEPVEIFSLVSYLQQRSQPFEYLTRPEVSPVDDPEAQIARGRQLFQERGCLVCHEHKEFADATAFRDPVRTVQGPNLSAVGSKFDPERNPRGPDWLYSWIKNATRYHVRTAMPDYSYMTPIEHRDKEGKLLMTTDPVADIVAFLIARSKSDWKPADSTLTELPGGPRVAEFTEQELTDLEGITLEHLKDTFYVRKAEQYLKRGIPERMRRELKGAEQELLVPDEDYEAGKLIGEQQMLAYVGRKSVTKWGCYGCHDIPGFEDAKPIGAALADWGRKEPAKLAFEHILEYIEHQHAGHAGGHGHAESHDGDHGPGEGHDSGEGHEPKTSSDGGDAHPGEAVVEHNNYSAELPDYFHHALESGHREGFLYQKLLAPRSYDYHKTENKKYNERLRMPQFPFSDEDRQAVMTFVLGLVADPPSNKFIFSPSPRQEALIAGRRVIEKFNCDGCHLLDSETWQVGFRPDYYGAQSLGSTFPFVMDHFPPEQLEQSAELDYRGMRTALIRGMPALFDDGKPRVQDIDEDDVAESTQYDPSTVMYHLQVWKPSAVDGHGYQVNDQPLVIPAEQIQRRFPFQGGFLARYLVDPVTQQFRPSGRSGKEAWGWVPPPLIGEGSKVQSEWLHDFLLKPYSIRPEVVLQMPRFNMNSDEATALVNYFAAKDNADYPYVPDPRKRSGYLVEEDQQYRESLEGMETSEGRRLVDAMKMVTNKNYCIQCHYVGDFVPSGKNKAPDLSRIHKRLRTDYLRRWIGKPTSILPYTAMPVNVAYDPDQPFLGSKVPQDLYHGNAIQQVDALVDLLMNYDQYTKQRTLIAPLVEEQNPMEPAPAAGGENAASQNTGGG